MTDAPKTTYSFATTVIHAGQDPDKWDSGQVVPPITLATTYKQPLPGEPRTHFYSRYGNPTRDVLQENLAAMEGAKFCKVYGSGTAAVVAVSNLVKSGEEVILNENGYAGTLEFFRDVASEQHGVKLTVLDLSDSDALRKALNSKTKLVWFETPTNPLLKITDIAEVVKTVKDFNKNIIVCVDSTFMTPYNQRPLALGVDIVMHSLSKYINGHSDVLMGAAITNREDLHKHLTFAQYVAGAVPSPFDCYLANRGAKTLHLRMKAHGKNALAVAKFLESSPRVEKVLYPELESHPQHEIHKRQSSGASGMVTFYLRGGLQESQTFLKSLKIFAIAESLGGVESLANFSTKMTHAYLSESEKKKVGIADNLIRLSVGIEGKDDLIADLDQALKKAIVL